ncbi:MAG: Hsp20/alpha crystallin family protein [Flammeovirgaceae bacterium]
MSIIKKSNGGFPTIRSVFSDLFDSDKFFESDLFKRDLSPAVNIKDNENNFEIEVACPGFDKEDFNVTVDNGLLTISAEHKTEKEEKEEKYARREFSYSSFSRSFSLPESADDENISGKYEGGILRMIIGKKEASSKVKKEVSIG